jgi:hypothetical protein
MESSKKRVNIGRSNGLKCLKSVRTVKLGQEIKYFFKKPTRRHIYFPIA